MPTPAPDRPKGPAAAAGIAEQAPGQGGCRQINSTPRAADLGPTPPGAEGRSGRAGKAGPSGGHLDATGGPDPLEDSLQAPAAPVREPSGWPHLLASNQDRSRTLQQGPPARGRSGRGSSAAATRVSFPSKALPRASKALATKPLRPAARETAASFGWPRKARQSLAAGKGGEKPPKQTSTRPWIAARS